MAVTKPNQVVNSRFLVPNGFDLVGDSRASQATTSAGYAVASQTFFTQANALAGHRYILANNFGISGFRSDQYILSAISAGLLATNSQWVLVFMPALNDIAQSGGAATFVNTMNGDTVTAANCAAEVVSNLITLANRVLALGKKVIFTLETGSTTMSAAQISVLHNINDRIIGFVNSTPGTYVFSANGVLWSQTSSATAIAYNAGYSTDGIHFTTLGAFASGVAFNTFFQTLMSLSDLAIANINDVQTTYSRQLINNPLFTTLTGGTATTINLAAGTVPNGWNISGAATTNVTITSSADVNGYGNRITLAITATTSDQIRFLSQSPSNGNYTLSQWMQGGMDVTVSSGASNISVFFGTDNVTNLGDTQQFDLLSQAVGPGPSSVAYTYRLQSLPKPVLPGSSAQSFLLPCVLYILSSGGAGSATIQISRAYGGAVYNYNSVTGFSA